MYPPLTLGSSGLLNESESIIHLYLCNFVIFVRFLLLDTDKDIQ